MNIYLRFVGNIAVPVDESELPEELSAEELEKIKAAKLEKQQAENRIKKLI